MAYIKTNWATAKITPENLNHMQEQYQEAVNSAFGVRLENTELRCEVVSDFPAHKAGRSIFHTGLKTFFFSTGMEWHIQPYKVDFGNANLGNFTSTGNITINNTVGESIVRNYNNFTLKVNHTLKPANPCRFLAIRAWGDIDIQGTIDLSYMGGYGDRYQAIFGTQYDLMGGEGGNGGNGAGSTNGGKTSAGETCSGGLRGGGGGAGGSGTTGKGGNKNTRADTYARRGFGQSAYTRDYSSAEANGMDGIACGGGGAGAQVIGDSGNTSLTAVGGSGGIVNLANNGASGGGGHCSLYNKNMSYTAGSGTSGKAGGGVLLLIAMGKVTIGGQVLARGGNGGNGGRGYYLWYTGYEQNAYHGGGGGGSGGGSVLVIHQNGYNNAGLINVSGGLGGSGEPDWGVSGENGSNGAEGSINVVKLV